MSPPTVEDVEEYATGAAYDQSHDHPQIAQPPRLSGPGGCARCLIALTLVACFGAAVWIVMLAVNRLPFTVVHTSHVAASSSSTASASASARPLPALLKRFAKLEKAAPPLRGASDDSVDLLFPHWKADPASAVRDVAFGVALLAQHLQSAQPAAPTEDPEARLEQDTDL